MVALERRGAFSYELGIPAGLQSKTDVNHGGSSGNMLNFIGNGL